MKRCKRNNTYSGTLPWMTERIVHQLAFCNKRSHGIKSTMLEDKWLWQPSKQSDSNQSSLNFFVCLFFFVPAHSLPSSMADFVPCDCPLQKTYYTDFQIPFVPRPLFKRSQQISYLFLLIAETLTILYWLRPVNLAPISLDTSSRVLFNTNAFCGLSVVRSVLKN